MAIKTNDKILITGGLGFIGLEIARQLAQRRQPLVLLDNLSQQVHGALPNFSDRGFLHNSHVQVLRGDVRESDTGATALKDIRCVIHLAAETGTGQSMYEIRRYTDTNVGGTATLLDYLANQRHSVEKIVLASSRSVYGEGAYLCERCGMVYPPERPAAMLCRHQWEPLCPKCGAMIHATATPECASPQPASVYAATKLAQEGLVRIAAAALGIGAVIFRFQNVYGEGQSLKNPYTGILSIFSNQLRLGKVLDLYEDGRESRDFVHVSDVARAVLLSLDSDRADGFTLNVGSGLDTSVATIADLLRERIGGHTSAHVSGHYRIGDVRHEYADLSGIRKRLGFAPEISLEAGLDRFVAWVKGQPVESDRLSQASEELASRGLMQRDDQAITV
jgi:dTDP-L-rhamnose 4-epimerase